MNIQISKSPIGLDGVPAAETALSHVDGERGELIIAGERVDDLARNASFEGVTARLWSAATGMPTTEAAVRAQLGAARERAFARLPQLLPATLGLSVVDGTRAAIAALRSEPGLSDEATTVGAIAVIAGALVQRTRGRAPVAPDPIDRFESSGVITPLIASGPPHSEASHSTSRQVRLRSNCPPM